MHMFPIRSFVGFVAKFNRTTTGQIGKCNATPPDNKNNSNNANNCNMSAALSPRPASPHCIHTPPPFFVFVLIDEWRGQSIKWPATTQICLRIQIQLQNTPTLCYPSVEKKTPPPTSRASPPHIRPFLRSSEVVKSLMLFVLWLYFIAAFRSLIPTATWTLTSWPSVNPFPCVCVCVCERETGADRSGSGE